MHTCQSCCSQGRLERAPTARYSSVAKVSDFRQDSLSGEILEVSAADSLLVLSRGLDTTGFTNSLYQWASTLTSSGQNMPFALPIKADKLDNGFQVSSD